VILVARSMSRIPSSGPRSSALWVRSRSGGAGPSGGSRRCRRNFAYGHRGVRQIGNAGKQVAEVLVHGLDLLFQHGDAVADLADLELLRGGVHTFPAQFADLGALAVTHGAQGLGFGEGRPALEVEFPKLLQVEGEAASANRVAASSR